MAKNKKIKSVFVVGNPAKQWVINLVDRVCQWLPELVSVDWVDTSMRDKIPMPRPDMVLAFGGDGTILSTARRLGKDQCPVLGINTGHIGFLASLSPEDLRPWLEQILKGNYEISERVMLRGKISRNGGSPKNEIALNDIALARGPISRSVSLEVSVDGEHAVTYEGDGVIISTPTGSTAYSLSAGGPILMPGIEAIVISPICPFALSQRPIVLAGDSVIAMKVIEAQSAVVAVDGQVHYEIGGNDFLEIRKFPVKFQLVDLPGQSHYRILRNKLHWGVHPRQNVQPETP